MGSLVRNQYRVPSFLNTPESSIPGCFSFSKLFSGIHSGIPFALFLTCSRAFSQVLFKKMGRRNQAYFEGEIRALRQKKIEDATISYIHQLAGSDSELKQKSLLLRNRKIREQNGWQNTWNAFFSALEPLLSTTELSLLFTGRAKSSESNWKATTFKKYSKEVKNFVKGYNDDACQKHSALINNFRDIIGDQSLLDYPLPKAIDTLPEAPPYCISFFYSMICRRYAIQFNPEGEVEAFSESGLSFDDAYPEQKTREETLSLMRSENEKNYGPIPAVFFWILETQTFFQIALYLYSYNSNRNSGDRKSGSYKKEKSWEDFPTALAIEHGSSIKSLFPFDPFHSAENVIERVAESFWISYSLLSANSKDGNIIRNRIPDGVRHIYCQYIYKIKLLVSELQTWEKWLKLPKTGSIFNDAAYKLDTILTSIANCSENNIHGSLLYINEQRDSFSEPVNNSVGRGSWLQFWSAASSSRPWLKPFYVMALLSSKSCIHELPTFVTDFFEMLLEDFEQIAKEYSDACISDYVPSINELRS